MNRCHAGLISHASGVQLASPQPEFWGSRSTGGPLACNQQMRVRFPPLPPNSPGRPLRSRRRSEKPDKHVRLVLLAPSVAVAEWLRRQTVDLSTRVRFPPVTPLMCSSCAWFRIRGRSFGSSPADHCFVFSGTRETDQPAWPGTKRISVRIRGPRPISVGSSGPPHSMGGRSGARTRVFEARYGSSNLPLPTRLSARSSGLRATD